MLNKLEEKILSTVKDLCSDKSSCLVTPTDILRVSGLGGVIDSVQLEDILKTLSFDDYFDLIYSSRKGEKVYCISLQEKCIKYQRNKILIKRDLKYKFILTVSFAVLSFIIGLLLKAIFN